MINTSQLQAKVMQHLVQNAGLEQRTYLGISSIGYCPRKLYFDFVQARTFTERDARYCYVGYLYERDAKTRLAATGLYRPGSEREIVSTLDPRFKGHTDGETPSGELLELKSVNPKRLERVLYTQQPLNEHLAQVQCYLHYGNYESALMVYINRDDFSHVLLVVEYEVEVALQYEDKARRVLSAIDARMPPACECGWCKF